MPFVVTASKRIFINYCSRCSRSSLKFICNLNPLNSSSAQNVPATGDDGVRSIPECRTEEWFAVAAAAVINGLCDIGLDYSKTRLNPSLGSSSVESTNQLNYVLTQTFRTRVVSGLEYRPWHVRGRERNWMRPC